MTKRFTICVRFHSHRAVRVLKSITDDPERFEGLPVGVQVVAPNYQEEIVLGLGEVVDSALKFK